MKKNIFIIVIGFLFASTVSFAQLANPGDGAGGVGGAPGPVGGGAPIGSGLFIMASLGFVYGGKKIFQLNSVERSKI